MHIVFLRALRSQHESLCEASHRLASIGQFAGHLDNDSVTQCTLRINLGDLGMAVAEVQLLDLLMDLLLTNHRGCFTVRVQTAVHERRLVVVEPVAEGEMSGGTVYLLDVNWFGSKCL